MYDRTNIFVSKYNFTTVVNNPLVKMVILDSRSIDFAIEFQTLSANGCLSWGKSVVQGAPNLTELSVVHLKRKTDFKFF